MTMNPGGSEFGPTTIRSVVEKSVGLLERRCIRLNGRDLNCRALFDEQIDDIVHAVHSNHVALAAPSQGRPTPSAAAPTPTITALNE
jgi:hypothetical protein